MVVEPQNRQKWVVAEPGLCSFGGMTAYHCHRTAREQIHMLDREALRITKDNWKSNHLLVVEWEIPVDELVLTPPLLQQPARKI